ncbi:phage integrase SAM-like domain-containing protein [Chryseobacterium sp.]|uniref:phage integrase SAM-like domain-containing protein n=1 Tax=Chryseobacterium sp. TaxID=1871047 RepID=UPI0038901D97
MYTEFEKEKLRLRELGNQNFVDYFKKLADKRKASNYDNWISALHYLEAFTKGTLKFVDLNESIFEDFKDYLLTTKSKRSNKETLSVNSAVSYFNKIKATCFSFN